MGRLIVVCVVLVLFAAAVLGQTPAPDCNELKTRLERAETKLKDWSELARYRAS
jgi:hypothetical protein